MSTSASQAQHTIQVSLVGEDALLFVFSPITLSEVPLQTQQRIWQLYAWLDPQRSSLGLIEIVPGMGNLLLRATQKTLLNSLQDLVLSHWPQLSDAVTLGRTIEIPVHYGGADGPDIAFVAEQCEMDIPAVIEAHSQRCYHVYCLGFQPGFAYLGDLDKRLELPRRETPRLSIAPGSVAIAGSQTAVYPSASPGGWHIIGYTEIPLFNPSQSPATLLQIGDSVRFVPVGGVT